MANKMDEKAFNDFSAVINKNVTIGEPYYWRGIILENVERFGVALEDYSSAIKNNFSNEDIHKRRFKLYLKNKQYDLAIADLTIIIDKYSPKSDSIWNERGKCYAALNKHELALVDFNKAIMLNKDFEEAYINRANSKVALKKDASALADYNKILYLNPKNGFAYEGRGIYYFNRKNFNAAREDFDKAIKFSPNSAKAYYFRGAMKDENGDGNGACEDLRKAADLGYEDAIAALKRVCGGK